MGQDLKEIVEKEKAAMKKQEAEEEEEGDEIDQAFGAILGRAAEKAGVSREILASILGDLTSVVREDKKVKKLLDTAEVIKRIADKPLGPATEVAADMTVARAITKYGQKVLEGGEEDDMKGFIREIEKVALRLMAYRYMLESVFSHPQGQAQVQPQAGDSEKVFEVLMKRLEDLERKIEQKKAEEAWREAIKTFTDKVSELVSGLRDELKKVQPAEPPGIAEIKAKIDRWHEAISSLEKRMEQIEKKEEHEKFESLKKEIEALKSEIRGISLAAAAPKQGGVEEITAAAAAKVEELKRFVESLKDATEKLNEVMQSLGRTPESEALRRELEMLRMKAEELEKKASMGEAIKELLSNPQSFSNFVRGVTDLVTQIGEAITKARSFVSQVQQPAQVPAVAPQAQPAQLPPPPPPPPKPPPLEEALKTAEEAVKVEQQGGA